MFVFIVGRGRSGTTLLRSMLDRHPDISIAPESLFIMNTYKKYHHGKWDNVRAEKFYKDLWLESKLKNWNLNKSDLKDRIMRDCENENFSSICKKIYMQYASECGKKNVACIGDKNPHYSLFLRQLIETFPEARFIHLIRDYRDNICSYRRMKFDVGNTVSLSYRWLKYNREILKFSLEYPDRFIRVRFEDLITDPVQQLSNVCVFLNAEFNNEMLIHDDRDLKHNQVWHKNIAIPPDHNLICQWKTQMSPKDIVVSEHICGKFSRRFDYKCSQNSRYIMSVIDSFWYAYGYIYTMMEELLFLLPIVIRSKILSYYRSITGTNMN